MSAVVDDVELELLLHGIHVRYGQDFRSYARASLKRRMAEALARLGHDTVSALAEDALRDEAVFLRLLDFLTISTTELFRDPAFYAALRQRVLPYLSTYASLKVWVAGCSTGEEVVSLCILLAEAGVLERTIVYATDINPGTLARAQRGIYAIDEVASSSRNYLAAGGATTLSDYYASAYGAVLFSPSLLSRVVFADHSLATDAVFSEVQLVSCRNVLIYFQRQLQDRALGLFRDALCHRGFLALGGRETLRFSIHETAFEPVVEGQRIYQRR